MGRKYTIPADGSPGRLYTVETGPNGSLTAPAEPRAPIDFNRKPIAKTVPSPLVDQERQAKAKADDDKKKLTMRTVGGKQVYGW